MVESRALRVLSVAHTAVSRAAGRMRYHPLAGDRTLDLTLVVPARWYQFGRWREADPADDPIRIVTLPVRLPRAGPASWYLHHYPALGPTVRGIRPDIIHLWEEPWGLVALQACRLARRCGAALVLEVDQNIVKRLPPPFEQIRRHVLARTDLVLSRSPAATAVVRACGYRGPTAPIGYGVDESVFRLSAAPVTAMPLPDAAFRLGYVGRLVEEKGLDDVLQALIAARPDITLDIMGEGPHAAALQARVAEAGLSARVRFRPWGTPDAVAAFLQSLSALVLPTRTTASVKEQFGRVIIEAQACGTPVIGSTSGAIPDVIGLGGWIVGERDPAALTAVFDRLAGAPEEVAARARSGCANVHARFTIAAVARDLAQGWREAARLRQREHEFSPQSRVGTSRLAGAEPT